jgi:hypothetical protein
MHVKNQVPFLHTSKYGCGGSRYRVPNASERKLKQSLIRAWCVVVCAIETL